MTLLKTYLWRYLFKALCFHVDMSWCHLLRCGRHPGSSFQADGSCTQPLASHRKEQPLPILAPFKLRCGEMSLRTAIQRPGFLPWSHDHLHAWLWASGFQFVNEDADLIHLPFHSAQKSLGLWRGGEAFKQSPAPDFPLEEPSFLSY